VAGSRESAARRRLPLALILLIAAALRIGGLTAESLWLDEGHTVWRISQPAFEMLPDADEGAQGPLYYFGLKVWCEILGNGPFMLRFPSALFGIAAVPLFFWLGRRWFGESTGLIAALLLATNPFAIHYAQDARPYTLFLFLSAASFVYLGRLLDSPRGRDGLLYALSTASAVYTHAFSAFLLLAHAVVYAIERRFGGKAASAIAPRRFAALLAVILLAAAPVVVQYGAQYAHMANGTADLPLPQTTVRLLGKALFNYFMWPWLSIAAFTLMAVVLPFELRRNAPLRAPVLAAAAIAGLSIGLPWLASSSTTAIFTPRYSIPGLVGLLLLVAASLAHLGGARRVAATAVFIVLTAVPLYRYYTMVDKDPWRQTAAFVEQAAAPGDVIVAVPPWTMRPFGYHLRPPEGVRVAAPRDTALVDTLLAGTNRIWLVASYPARESVVPKYLANALAASARAGETNVINESLRINPDALHIARIRVTPFDMLGTISNPYETGGPESAGATTASR
jgi:uncharacterized membrane protein